MFDPDYVKPYLKRLHYTAAVHPGRACLQALHRQHLLTIPLENLDIHYHQAITLDIEKIYHKIVNNHRGGFCYELNGLFYELLQAAGFAVKRISGRV